MRSPGTSALKDREHVSEAIRLDFPTWTPIAARGREPTAPKGRNSRHTWIPGETMDWLAYPDAPLTIEEATDLRDAGHLLTANRHYPDRVELVIRSAPPGTRPRLRTDALLRHEIALAKADVWPRR